jgi:hypothetical protein
MNKPTQSFLATFLLLFCKKGDKKEGIKDDGEKMPEAKHCITSKILARTGLCFRFVNH